MDRPHPGTAQEGLDVFLGHWTGTTHIEATPLRPARSAAAELTFTKAAAGYAVLQSYRHTETDGISVERHGMFTMDADHPDTVWYHVDSLGQPREARLREARQVTHPARPFRRFRQASQDHVLKMAQSGIPLQLGVQRAGQLHHHAHEG